MKTFKYHIAILLFTPLIASCSAWNNYLAEQNRQKLEAIAVEERTICAQGWSKLGMRTSLENESSEQGIRRYTDLCLKHRYSVNISEWNKGYKEGSTQYCTYLHAYKVAKQGDGYSYSRCQKKDASKLNQAYSLGAIWQQKNAQVAIYEDYITEYDSEIRYLKSSISSKDLDKEKSESNKIDQRKLKSLYKERESLFQKLTELRRDREVLDSHNLSALIKLGK